METDIITKLTNKEVIDLWYHYEQIAMHFNQLIIQYRIQLMGSFGAIGAISAYLIGNNIKDLQIRVKVQFIVSFVILILFSTSVYLDMFYYNELLRSSVKVIIELENKHDYLNMSSSIKENFKSGASNIMWTVYGIIFIVIFGFTFYSFYICCACSQPKSVLIDEIKQLKIQLKNKK